MVGHECFDGILQQTAIGVHGCQDEWSGGKEEAVQASLRYYYIFRVCLRWESVPFGTVIGSRTAAEDVSVNRLQSSFMLARRAGSMLYCRL